MMSLRLANHDASFILEQGTHEEVFHDVVPSGPIDRSEWIIENKCVRMHAVGCACHGDTGALATRKRNAAATEGHFVATRQDLQVGTQGGAEDCFLVALRVVTLMINHILLQGAFTNEGYLAVVGEVLRNLQARILQWQHLPESGMQQRALAGADLANDGHHLTMLDVDVEVLQYCPVPLLRITIPREVTHNAKRWLLFVRFQLTGPAIEP
mmetsp:Transcript_77682/g.166537  ORF Transcript_77682/g.166537 Transcript_77682/m.166537 type:complete len:211 (+) Transcript_77682:1300-1932(+)